MKRKLLPLIGIAFVVALISTAAFYSLFSARMRAAPVADPRHILVTAARTIEPGAVVKREDLATLPWNGPEAPPGAFTALEQVAGKTASEQIPRGELILASRLAAQEGATPRIPEGMRAVSVHVSDSVGVVGMLKPGHKVDLQVFGSRTPEERQRGVRTLLRGVSVLAVAPEPKPSSQGYFSAPVVTVLATAAEAEQLAFADSFLRLRIALRNPGEPAERAAAPPPARRESGQQVLVRTFGMSEENLSTLLKRLDRPSPPETFSVDAPGPFDVAEFLAQHRAQLESEAAVTPGSARFSYIELPRPEGRNEKLRVGLAAGSGPGRLRVRRERWIANEQPETHSLETEVRISNRRYVIVGGLGARRVMVISAGKV